MKRIILLFITCALIFSCTSKVARPKLIGVIVDRQGIPIDSCMVGETFTDKNGRFELPEITYLGFISLFGSIPVYIEEEIKKNGYELKRISTSSGRGGLSVGSVWNMDTIQLRKIPTNFSAIKLNDIWFAGITKNLDTIFLTKKNPEYDEWQVDFISSKCDTYSKGYYYGLNNLPKDVFERHIELDLASETLKIKKVLVYGNTSTDEKTKYDTIYGNGKWKQQNKLLTFNISNFDEINGNYTVVDFNYNSIQLIKN